MKIFISFITLLIFLHMISAEFELFDTGMEHLVAGTPYYLLPVKSDNGGGLYSYQDNSTCYAAREPIDDLPSQAVIFNHDKSKVGDWLSPSKDLNIRFESVFCELPSSGVLQVDKVDEATGKYMLTLGGVEGNPGCGTVANWFQIEKIIGEYSYKLVYCPSVCDLFNVTCRDVKSFKQNGIAFPLLVLSEPDDDYPLLFRFHKAHPCGSKDF